MKVFMLIALLPLAFAGEKRFLFDGLLDSDMLNHYKNQIIEAIGSDANEQTCETKCHEMLGGLAGEACGLICKGFQTGVNALHTDEGTAAPAKKRFILDSLPAFDMSSLFEMFDGHTLAGYIDQIVEDLGSDQREQDCEDACHNVIQNAVLDEACAFICSSMQSIINKLHSEGYMTTTAASPVAKRFIFDDLDLSHLKQEIHMIVEEVGSDANKEQCNAACHDIITNELAATSCSFICASFQTILQQIDPVDVGATADPNAPVINNKRFLADSFTLDSIMQMLGANDFDTVLNTIVAQVGSDASEKQCEEACYTTDLPPLGCPVLCSGFQQLVQGFHVTD